MTTFMAAERVSKEVQEYLRRKGRRLGKRYGALGAAVTNANLTTATRRQAGKKAAAKLTPAERKARARKAATARWQKLKVKSSAEENA